jgi:hypothetical protein
MNNVTIVALTYGSNNAHGAFFENHTIVKAMPHGGKNYLLFTPGQSIWRCYKIDKMPNYVNISIRTMLHLHLRPQGFRVWASIVN